VRIVHRVSRFVHAVAAREFPPGPEKSAEIRKFTNFACRGSIASTVWPRCHLPEPLGPPRYPLHPDRPPARPRKASRQPLRAGQGHRRATAVQGRRFHPGPTSQARRDGATGGSPRGSHSLASPRHGARIAMVSWTTRKHWRRSSRTARGGLRSRQGRAPDPRLGGKLMPDLTGISFIKDSSFDCV
jgi:hypothetical protein